MPVHPDRSSLYQSYNTGIYVTACYCTALMETISLALFQPLVRLVYVNSILVRIRLLGAFLIALEILSSWKSSLQMEMVLAHQYRAQFQKRRN